MFTDVGRNHFPLTENAETVIKCHYDDTSFGCKLLTRKTISSSGCEFLALQENNYRPFAVCWNLEWKKSNEAVTRLSDLKNLPLESRRSGKGNLRSATLDLCLRQKCWSEDKMEPSFPHPACHSILNEAQGAKTVVILLSLRGSDELTEMGALNAILLRDPNPLTSGKQ